MPGQIESAEDAFTREARSRGLASAYAQSAAADLRLYRPGAAPALDRAQALERELPDARGWAGSRSEARWRARGTSATRAGATPRPPRPTSRSGTSCTSGATRRGAWRLVLDVVNPASAK
jgi:hypothetical protein